MHMCMEVVLLTVWFSVDRSGLSQLLDNIVEKVVDEFLQPVRNGLIPKSP